MIIPYPLSDGKLIDRFLALCCNRDPELQPVSEGYCFVPEQRYVSLGASNSLEDNVQIDTCQSDGVKVFRRLCGGEAVYLSPNCVVYTSVLVAGKPPKAADFFGSNLENIAQKLTAAGITGIERRGISDLTLGERKFLGCAIYRKSGFILYQAVINVKEDPQVISRYLKHPVREPDYRKSRPHSEFITSLQAQGYRFEPQEIAIMLGSSPHQVIN